MNLKTIKSYKQIGEGSTRRAYLSPQGTVFKIHRDDDCFYERLKKTRCSIMEDLGVSLEFNSGKWDSGVGLVVDGEEYALHDVCGGDENHYLNHFPPMFECGLRIQREE